MRGNGDSVLDLDLLVSPWSFWFCPWSCWFVTANLKRSFTRKEKPKKRKKKKRKKLKQKLFLRPRKRPRWRSKSSLKELLATTRMADFSTVFILKPKFFCENHTRQKLFYISSYVKFLVKIILIVIETRPKHGLCSCNKSAAYSYQFNNICRTINSSQKENREITTGKTWQHPKLTSNPALDKVESDAKW